MSKESILKELSDIVGAKHVSADVEDLVAYTKSFPNPISHILNPFLEVVKGSWPEYIVRPGNVEEIQQIVRLASRHKIPLYPYCFGSWAFAPVKGGIVLDLRRLNRIIKIDEESMTAIIEPGVRQAELIKEARKKGLDAPVNLGPGTGSIVANYALNGGGSCATGHNDTIALEAVIGNGELIRTGSWASPLFDETNPYARYGFGTDITGLFRCSNGALGVITKTIYRLHPLREAEEVVWAGFKDIVSTVECMETILRLGINHYMVAGDRLNMALSAVTNPEHLKKPAEIKKLEALFPEYTLWVGLSGTIEQVFLYNKLFEEAVSDYDGIMLKFTGKIKENLDDLGLGSSKIVHRPFIYPWAGVMYLGPRSGIPKVREMTIQLLKEYDIIDPVTGEKPFKPGVWLMYWEPNNTVFFEQDILYDPMDSEAVEKCKKFIGKYYIEAAKYGSPPLAMSPAVQPLLMPTYVELLKSIKKILDPNGIFAPGIFIEV